MSRRRTAGPRAFTLIEVLVVIGIIVLLIAALVVTGRHVIDSSRGSRTRVTLETLRGATDAADRAGLFNQQPVGAWINGTWAKFRDANGSMLVDSGTNRTGDFWRQPDSTASKTTPTAVQAPGAPVTVRDEPGTPAPWITSDAMRNTGIALALLHNIPGAAAPMDQLHANELYVPTFWSSASAYAAGARVVWTDTTSNQQQRVFVSVKGSPASNFVVSDWRESYGTVLDAWGNPMLFVPGSGLKVTINGVPSVVTSAGTVTIADITGGVRPNPVGKPFWASAGPDGDFSRGDDNLYSFEPK